MTGKAAIDHHLTQMLRLRSKRKIPSVLTGCPLLVRLLGVDSVEPSNLIPQAVCQWPAGSDDSAEKVRSRCGWTYCVRSHIAKRQRLQDSAGKPMCLREFGRTRVRCLCCCRWQSGCGLQPEMAQVAEGSRTNCQPYLQSQHAYHFIPNPIRR